MQAILLPPPSTRNFFFAAERRSDLSLFFRSPGADWTAGPAEGGDPVPARRQRVRTDPGLWRPPRVAHRPPSTEFYRSAAAQQDSHSCLRWVDPGPSASDVLLNWIAALTRMSVDWSLVRSLAHP